MGRTALIDALNLQKEELELFQSLNGLDENYNSQRSNLLMMRRLPTVEEACSSLHQSESHIEVLKPVKEVESLVMFIKGEASCIACGKVGHTKGNYWFIVGFPPKGQKDQRGKGKDYSNAKSQKWQRRKIW